MIVFHPLDKEHITQIVTILVKEVQRRLGQEVRLTPAATDFLAGKGFDQSYGARPLKRAIQKYVEDPLSEKILLGEFGRTEDIEVDVAGDGEQPGLPCAHRYQDLILPAAGPPGARRPLPSARTYDVPAPAVR